MSTNQKISIKKDNFVTYLESIKNWKIAEEDKKSILEFIKDYEVGKISGHQAKQQSIRPILSYLRISLEFIGKSASQFTTGDTEKIAQALLKDDIKKNISRFTERITLAPFTEIGKLKLKNALKAYLEWKLGEKAMALTRILKIKPRIKEPTPDYISENEVEKLYLSASNNEERFLIAVLFDSGARAEEFHNIRFEDIKLPSGTETFVQLTLKEEYSKTKGRVISLYWKHSLDAIREFLNQRTTQGVKYSDQVFLRSYSGSRQLLQRLGKRVLNRNVHYHLFRHSSATYYADKMNRQQLCYRYGWRFSSPMPDRYINRKGIQHIELDKKFESTKVEDLKLLLEEQSRQNAIMKLQQQELIQELDKRRKFDPLLDKLISNPKVLELLN